MESRRSGVERASLAPMDSRPGLPAVQLPRLRPFSISIFFSLCFVPLFLLLKAAVSKGGVPDSSLLKTLCLFFWGRSGLQEFCYSFYFLGAVDVLYALDVLCEMQRLAWIGCRYFVLHSFLCGAFWSVGRLGVSLVGSWDVGMGYVVCVELDIAMGM